ncbi:MAG: DUF2333 family protein [Thermodesulfobacteriota bacterium]
MEQGNSIDNGAAKGTGFKRYATKRMIVVVLLAVTGIWIVGLVLSFSKPADLAPPRAEHVGAPEPAGEAPEPAGHAQPSAHSKPEITPVTPFTPALSENDFVGIAFVQAVIAPMRHELDERFWGWRPNDILDFTDNINNFQLGVIETTRRTVERLTENISRTGSTAAFDKNLENARSSCFMVEAVRYWFPSPERKYEDGLEELETYMEKLRKGEAAFYTRADNLIPLLAEFEHLLGSCDDNLVKATEKNGSEVSFFRADDYLYYSKGVASTMATILEAVEKDFNATLERRNCLSDLHHAIESCHHAGHVDPVIVLNSGLNSIFANHRANMAAHISHARFYLSVLIKTLST